MTQISQIQWVNKMALKIYLVCVHPQFSPRLESPARFIVWVWAGCAGWR